MRFSGKRKISSPFFGVGNIKYLPVVMRIHRFEYSVMGAVILFKHVMSSEQKRHRSASVRISDPS